MTFVPSKYQEQIFNWAKDPTTPVMISAVAGSGKTTSLVKALASVPTKYRRILFAAFNKSIADELGKRLPEHVESRTIHSLGYGALRSAFPNIRKWDLDNGKNKYRYMVRDIKFDQGEVSSKEDAQTIQDALLKLLDFAQLTLTPLEVPALVAMADRFNIELPSNLKLDRAAELVADMLQEGKEKASQGLISYSDMIYMPLAMGLTMPKFDLLAIDEAQDLNKSQMTLLSESVAKGGKIIAVGDRNQAIYMFAGAESNSFDHLKKHFGAGELPLNFCYRCPEAVINEAKKIVPQIEAPPGTRAGVVGHLTDLEFQKMLRRGDMVLCRTTAPLIKLCFELIAQRIPAKVKGRDIGKAMTQTIKRVMGRSQAIAQFPGMAEEYLVAELNNLRQKLGSEGQQEALNDRIECLQICFTTFQPQTVDQFCWEVTKLFEDDGNSPITLCTAHRSKGLENPRVFIIAPEKMPLVWKNQSAEQAGQEMNLRYVAITRAQEELYFVHSSATESGF